MRGNKTKSPKRTVAGWTESENIDTLKYSGTSRTDRRKRGRDKDTSRHHERAERAERANREKEQKLCVSNWRVVVVGG